MKLTRHTHKLISNSSYFSQQYQTVLQTNADGTFSLIQVDPSTLSNNPSIITLPDGTTAQVQGVATVCYKLEISHVISH